MTDVQSTETIQQSAPAPVKRKRVRLPKPSTQLARVLQRLEVIVRKAEAGEIQLSPSRLTDIVLAQSKISLTLYREKAAADRQRAIDARRAAKSATARESEPAQSEDEPDISELMLYHRGRPETAAKS